MRRRRGRSAAGTSTTPSSGRSGERPVVADVDDLDVAARRRGATRSAARPPRCRRRRRGRSSSSGFSSRVGSRYSSSSSRLDVHDLLGPGVAVALLGHDRARSRSSSAGSRTGSRRSARTSSTGSADVVGQLVRRRPRAARAAGRRRRPGPPAPSDRWLSPTCSSSTRSGVDAEALGEARAGSRSPRCTARSPGGRRRASAWVTIPTGLVKSTIQAPGAAAARRSARRARARPARSAAPWRSRPARSSPGRSTPNRRRQRLVDRAGPPGRRRAAG